MRLVLQLLTYNSSAFLPALFESLAKQTDQDWRLLVRDDGSSSEELVATRRIVEHFANALRITFIARENRGFSGGHQELYASHDADLVFLVNHDAILEPEYLEKLRDVFERDPSVAAASGTILRWVWSTDHTPEFTNIVDSLGLKKTWWHGVYDIGSGRALETITKRKNDVFGVSGCLPMYRRSALGDVLFDSTYFMYKEDVDVAYRLGKHHARSVVVPSAIAYHFRGFQLSRLHLGVSVRLQEYSYRNHWRNLLKHLSVRDWLVDGIAILSFEIAKAAFLAFTHPGILWRTLRSFMRTSV